MVGHPSHQTLQLVLHLCGPAAGMALGHAVIPGRKTGGCSLPQHHVEPNVKRKLLGRLTQEEKDKVKGGNLPNTHSSV